MEKKQVDVKREPILTKPQVTAESVRKALYKVFLGQAQGSLDLSSFLSGASAVLHEVFPNADPKLASPAIPKIWYLGDEKRIIEHMRKEIES